MDDRQSRALKTVLNGLGDIVYGGFPDDRHWQMARDSLREAKRILSETAAAQDGPVMASSPDPKFQ